MHAKNVAGRRLSLSIDHYKHTIGFHLSAKDDCLTCLSTSLLNLFSSTEQRSVSLSDNGAIDSSWKETVLVRCKEHWRKQECIRTSLNAVHCTKGVTMSREGDCREPEALCSLWLRIIPLWLCLSEEFTLESTSFLKGLDLVQMDSAQLSTFVVTFYGHESTQVSTIRLERQVLFAGRIMLYSLASLHRYTYFWKRRWTSPSSTRRVMDALSRGQSWCFRWMEAKNVKKVLHCTRRTSCWSDMELILLGKTPLLRTPLVGRYSGHSVL